MTTSREERTASFKQFARILGDRSPSYITQLKEAGRLALTADGKRVRVQASLALIRETADPAREAVAARHAAARAKGGSIAATSQGAAPGADGADDEADADPTAAVDPESISHSRRKAKANADKAETDAKAADRDYRISMGQLLDATEVEAAAADAAINLRKAFENLASRLAPELAATNDEGRVRVILGDAVEHALDEAARTFAGLAKEAAV